MKTTYRWFSLVAATMIAGTVAFAADAPATSTATLNNLKTAYNGESNANRKYISFNAKAEQEGYRRVAQLFRAAAQSEATHAALFGTLISKFGEKPAAPIKQPDVRSTEENLTNAIRDEGEEHTVLYRDFTARAQADNLLDAVTYFTYARKVEGNHEKLYRQALSNLQSWKDPGPAFSDCTVCGNTVEKVDFADCPVCGYPAARYVPVQ